MIKDKQRPGQKTHIKIQVFKIRPIHKPSYRNFPRNVWKHLAPAKEFKHTIFVEVQDIDTQLKLAYVIRKHYGFGRFGIMFYSRRVRNKKYSERFVCKGNYCDYYDSCKIKTRHRKGWSCKKNRKYIYNWAKRAELEIIPILDFYTDIDFKFKWNRREDKMFYFKKWFWRGKK